MSIIFEKQTGCQFHVPEEKGSPVDAFKFLKENVKSKLDETQLNAIQKFLENRVTLIQVKWTHLYACYSTIYWKACFFSKQRVIILLLHAMLLLLVTMELRYCLSHWIFILLRNSIDVMEIHSLHIVPQEQINTERRGRVEDVAC